MAHQSRQNRPISPSAYPPSSHTFLNPLAAASEAYPARLCNPLFSGLVDMLAVES